MRVDLDPSVHPWNEHCWASSNSMGKAIRKLRIDPLGTGVTLEWRLALQDWPLLQMMVRHHGDAVVIAESGGIDVARIRANMAVLQTRCARRQSAARSHATR